LKKADGTEVSRKGSQLNVLTASGKPKRQVDHLKLFKKKMTKKFVDQEMARSQSGKSAVLGSTKSLSNSKAKFRGGAGQSERSAPRKSGI